MSPVSVYSAMFFILTIHMPPGLGLKRLDLDGVVQQMQAIVYFT